MQSADPDSPWRIHSDSLTADTEVEESRKAAKLPTGVAKPRNQSQPRDEMELRVAAAKAAAAESRKKALQLPMTDRERGREHTHDRLNEAEERRKTHTYLVCCLH